MIDILFTSIPFLETDEPVLAPGLLKAVAKSAGYSAKAIDLNAELMPIITKDVDAGKIINFLVHNNLHPDIFEKVTNLLDIATKRILSFNAHTVGLSLLTMHSQVFTYWLCVRLKSVSPHTKILIGGAGIKHTLVSEKNQFCDNLRNLKLIDHYITGDGELALIEFLKGNYSYPGIDSQHWQEIRDIDNFPYPDFDDYNLKSYSNPGIPITDSRGCVRTCEFCDIIEHWKKFTYRTAKSVFNEMLEQINRYNITKFNFMNSLTNGNLREFKELMTYIAEYNTNQDVDKQISWTGYFIVRAESQHSEDLWKIMSKTNPYLLLGVESVVQHIRWGLGKKFNNEDIDYHLEMAKKYKVDVALLLIVGYPTETREDYEFTKQWLRDRVEIYGYGNPVKFINLSHTSILENTKLDRDSEKLNLTKGKYSTLWINRETQISSEERAQYFKELYQISKPFNPPTGLRLEGYESLEKIAQD